MPSTTTIAFIIIFIAVASISIYMVIRKQVKQPFKKKSKITTSEVPSKVLLSSPKNVLMVPAPPTSVSINRRCKNAVLNPVLNSFVELRSATDACPSPNRAPPAQIPYADISVCPFLQKTNNQPTPISERVVPTRSRPGSTCPRINVWWSDVCGVHSL